MKSKNLQNTTPTIAEVVNHVHHEVVRECEYCGRPMSRSDVNDYGSLCEA